MAEIAGLRALVYADQGIGPTIRMAWLTKSRFLSGLQCHKRLWFETHQPLEEVVPTPITILQGRTFDRAVQELLPGVVISRSDGMPAAIAETKRVLADHKGVPAILHQSAFRAGDLAVITDVLRRSGSQFELIEVKASTAVKETHIPDAAFQFLVLRRAKIPVGKVYIGHVNNQFVLRQAGDYQGLLAETEITGEVHAYLPEAATRAVQLQEVMASKSMPAVPMGARCHEPYECPFIERCTAEVKQPEYPIGLLPRGGKLIDQLVAQGFQDIRDVPPRRLTNEVHRRVLDATTSGLPYFDLTATMELRGLSAPFAYLDFETISFSVPEVIGTRPYEQLPFQWSVHVEHSATHVSHSEYLAIESFGDFAAIAGALLTALPAAGTIFAYNASFEAGVLGRLADRLPTHADALRGVAQRLVDLLPIARQAYYHRDMLGSWSIKSIVPTIAPELGYETLDEVQEGDGAQRAFLELRSAGISAERKAELKLALLRYCAHDTWVMVILRRFLCSEALGNTTVTY